MPCYHACHKTTHHYYFHGNLTRSNHGTRIHENAQLASKTHQYPGWNNIDGPKGLLDRRKDLQSKEQADETSPKTFSKTQISCRCWAPWESNYYQSTPPNWLLESAQRRSHYELSKSLQRPEKRLIQVRKLHELHFSGKHGEWKGTPITISLIERGTSIWAKHCPVPLKNPEVFMQELSHESSICTLHELFAEETEKHEWASPGFVVPKKNGTIRPIFGESSSDWNARNI